MEWHCVQFSARQNNRLKCQQGLLNVYNLAWLLLHCLYVLDSVDWIDIQYNPSNMAALGTQRNGPIWGVALLEGWAIPDSIEFGGWKTRKPLKPEHFRYFLQSSCICFKKILSKTPFYICLNMTSHILINKSDNFLWLTDKSDNFVWK